MELLCSTNSSHFPLNSLNTYKVVRGKYNNNFELTKVGMLVQYVLLVFKDS